MSWISFEQKKPEMQSENYKIFVFLDGEAYIADVIMAAFIIIRENKFIYFAQEKKWYSDDRFKEPTHWMAIPAPPEEEK